MLDLSSAQPTVRAWVATHPLRALDVAGQWEQVLAAYRWLDGARGSGRFLREITAPGIDTKFVEQHRAVLGALLGVPSAAGAFVSALSLRAKPESVRLRFAPGALAMPAALSEATVRVEDLAAARAGVRTAVVVENEVTYLSVPVPEAGVVLWWHGFDVQRVAALPWLRAVDVHYWGDLDSHGFAILHQLRACLPQTQSFLMDRRTLPQHRDPWVREPSPTATRLDRSPPRRVRCTPSSSPTGGAMPSGWSRSASTGPGSKRGCRTQRAAPAAEVYRTTVLIRQRARPSAAPAVHNDSEAPCARQGVRVWC